MALEPTGNKLMMQKILLEFQLLEKFLPETFAFSDKHLWYLLDKYGEVILKPVEAHGGMGVIKVAGQQRQYELRIKDQRKTFYRKNDVYSFLIKQMKGVLYLVQSYIPLAEVQNLPFDLRVIVQKKISFDWEITGKLARLAKKGFIVTNIASGGKRVPVEYALKNSSIKHTSLEQMISDIDQLSLLIANRLGECFPNHYLYGLDLGIDKKGRLYLIEVNPWPWVKGFLFFDESVYRTIQSFIEYNRTFPHQ